MINCVYTDDPDDLNVIHFCGPLFATHLAVSQFSCANFKFLIVWPGEAADYVLAFGGEHFPVGHTPGDDYWRYGLPLKGDG